MDKILGQFIDIIEFMDETQTTLVHKFDRQGNEIKNGAQLIVRQSQVAVFIKEGRIERPQDQNGDVFQSGKYELSTNNLPILSTIYGWKYGFNSPFKAEVYFVSTKLFIGQKWGTQNPITMRDPEFGIVRLRARGTFSFRISNPLKFIIDLTGTNSNYDLSNLEDQLKSSVISKFTDALAEAKIPMLDLAQNYDELGDKILSIINSRIADLGIEIQKFVIENISLPPEVEAAIDKRGAMNVIGNLDNFAKYQAGVSMEQAAKNPGEGGGGMGAGIGMGMGMGMANMFSNQQQSQPQSSGIGGATPPPIPGAVSYFVALGGKQQGPFPLDQLKNLISQGQITKDSLVWKDGMPSWIKAGEVADIASLFGSTPPPIPQ